MSNQERPFPKVQGSCPSCGRDSLFLAVGGYVTCGNLNCPDPDTMAVLGAREEPRPFKQGDRLEDGSVFVCYTEDGSPIWAEPVKPHALCCETCARTRDALLAVFLDPLTSHGARALARETLKIPFIPFASPQEMLDATA